MKISVAIIGKDESKVIVNCLKSVKEADEILYMDTGSSDGTKEIVENLKWPNIRVLPQYQWMEDFSHARNTCTQQASNEWILTIDCDEVLDRGGIAVIKRELKLRQDMPGFNGLKCLVRIKSSDGQNFENSYQLRVHRKNNYWYRPTHNRLRQTNGFVEIVTGIDAGVGSHNVNDPTMRRRIIMKYLSSPEHTTDAEMWYYLGREHYRFGDLDSAIDCFKKMDQFTYLNYTDIYVDGMFVLAQCYYLMNKIDETRRALGQALSINPNFSKAMELISRVNPSWTKFWELTDDSNVIIKRKSVSIMDDREIRRRVAQLATIPDREGKLKQCLDSIIPFVDEVRVMLNNYDRVPAWMEKMETVVPVLRENQKGDAEKFYKVEDLKDTIIFILDDDLVYNEVFFNSCHDATIRYRCPVGYHGRINGMKFKAVDTNQMIRNVEFIITDSLCFTIDDCNITYNHFKFNDTASFIFSEYCHKNKINMLVLPHYKLRKI